MLAGVFSSRLTEKESVQKFLLQSELLQLYTFYIYFINFNCIHVMHYFEYPAYGHIMLKHWNFISGSCNDASVFGQPTQQTPERSSSFGPSWYSRSPNQTNGPLVSSHGGSVGSESRQGGNPFMIYNDLTYPRKSPSASTKGGPSKSVKTCETNGSMPTPGSQKSTKKEGMCITSELQGFSVKELVKALGRLLMHLFIIDKYCLYFYRLTFNFSSSGCVFISCIFITNI